MNNNHNTIETDTDEEYADRLMDIAQLPLFSSSARRSLHDIQADGEVMVAALRANSSTIESQRCDLRV